MNLCFDIAELGQIGQAMTVMVMVMVAVMACGKGVGRGGAAHPHFSPRPAIPSFPTASHTQCPPVPTPAFCITPCALFSPLWGALGRKCRGSRPKCSSLSGVGW